MKQINQITRKAVLPLLAMLALAAAALRAHAQPTALTPMAAAPDAAAQAWAGMGPTVTNIDYQGLPLSEVAHQLLKTFDNQFDVILPSKGEAGNTTIDLELKNVQAADVFHAMNLLFETEETPLGWKIHWKLILNGNRPTAVLEILARASVAPRPQSSVFYIGDLLTDATGIGFSPNKLIESIEQVQSETSRDETPPRLAFHPDAGLLVLTGTIDQINLTEATLSALHQKVSHDRPATYPGPRLVMPVMPGVPAAPASRANPPAIPQLPPNLGKMD